MTHAARFIDITPEIGRAYAGAISTLRSVMEAENTVITKGVVRAYWIGLDAYMTQYFVNSDQQATWRDRARETVGFVEDVGNECRAVAYRTAPWNGKLTQQGAAMLDVYGALQVLVKVIKDAIETGTVGGNE